MKPLLLLTALLLALPARAADPVEIKIGVLPGLKFDVPRCSVAP